MYAYASAEAPPCWSCTTMWPMPGSVVSTSTPMATSTEVVAASRSPVMIDGVALGSTTRRKRSRRGIR